MALPPEQRASYSAIIDDILSTSDLNLISAKQIRKGLQSRVDYDLTPQKDDIKTLIMERFDKVQSKAETTIPSVTEPAPTANGHVKAESRSASPPTASKRKAEESEELSDIVDSPPPAKKVKKKAAVPKPAERETDEEYAARLQAELNSVQGRLTRGGGPTRRKAPVKKEKKTKKKSASKVKAEDDSEITGSDAGGEEKVKKTGGFNKPMQLSEPLSQLLGEASLSRPQTVKRIWAHIKSNDLQDPSDKRQIICDEPMRTVFKQNKVHMFTMNKLLATHYSPMPEEPVVEAVVGEEQVKEEDE